jgi:tRNA threonylcarbamoyladenosine biosynthesis protein TsaB
MSCILHIETSTAVCSVAVSEDGQNIFVKEDLKGPSHAVSLGVFVDEALSFIDSHAIPLDAVAVSCGPGSYTGLRIGVSMAKGICYGRNVPLIGIPTLEVLSVPVLLYHELPEDALLCPMIDARRMEVYAAIYDRVLNVKREISADIVDENSYLEYLFTALCGSISKEIDRMLFQIFKIRILVHDIGGNLTLHIQRTVIDSRIYLHPPCINHRA